jgi:hypothetical protein
MDVTRLNALQVDRTQLHSSTCCFAAVQRGVAAMLDRLITTDMSASIIAGLLKNGWTTIRIARAIDAPLSFIHGVQAKSHVLTMKDIRKLARGSGQTPELFAFHAISPASIKPELRPLYESTRSLLERSSSVRVAPVRKATKKRRAGTKAA